MGDKQVWPTCNGCGEPWHDKHETECSFLKDWNEKQATPTPPACVVTEGEIEKAATKLVTDVISRRDMPNSCVDEIAKPNITALIHRAGGRVVPDKETLARLFHENYERLAPEFGYRTREASRVPWPPPNADLMIATADAILTAIAGEGE